MDGFEYSRDDGKNVLTLTKRIRYALPVSKRQPMQIFDERHGDVRIVTIDDHLDTTTAPVLEAKLRGFIESGDRRILIDCVRLQYVNSAGLKVFLLVAKRLESEGGELVLCALVPSVMMIFEMIGFNRIMKIGTARQDALAMFSAANVN